MAIKTIRYLCIGLTPLALAVNFQLLAAANPSEDPLKSALKNPQAPVEVIEVIGDNHYQSLNYQVILRDSFVNSSQTLADLLKDLNGIQIRQISGIGNPASVSIRGSTSKQVQLYIDGQLVNDSQFGGFDLNQIPTEHIQSIEVSKNQALGTGATPIGGVIRINTYNPKDSTLRLSAGIGSFGYRELNLINNQVFAHNNLSFGASRLQSDNDYSFLVPQTFEDPSVSAHQKLINNDFEKNAFFINNDSQWGQHQLRLNGQYSSQEKAIANYQNNTPENNTQLDTDSRRFGLQHNWQSQLTWLEQLEFEAYYQAKDEDYFDQPGGPINRHWRYQSDKTNLKFSPYFKFDQWQITPFIDYNEQDFDSVSTTNGQASSCNGIGACDIKANQQQLNFGSRIQWQAAGLPLGSYLLISQLQERNRNVATNRPNAPKFSTNKDYDTQEVGIHYQWSAIDLNASYSHGVRTPTLFELFGDRGAFKGNDDLQAEKARTLAIGGQYKNTDFSVSAAAYRQHLDNSIVAIFTSANVGSYDNVSNATLTGVELQGHYQLTPALSINLQANAINSNSKSEFVSFNDKKLPGIYHQQYSAGLQYQFTAQWKISLKTYVDHELYFNRANRFANNSNLGNGNPADRTLTDIYLSWQHNKMNATLTWRNAFDEDYQDLANRPAQGSSIQLKFSIEDF